MACGSKRVIAFDIYQDMMYSPSIHGSGYIIAIPATHTHEMWYSVSGNTLDRLIESAKSGSSDLVIAIPAKSS